MQPQVQKETNFVLPTPVPLWCLDMKISSARATIASKNEKQTEKKRTNTRRQENKNWNTWLWQFGFQNHISIFLSYVSIRNVFGFCFSFSMFTRTTVAAAEEAGGKMTRTPTCLFLSFSFTLFSVLFYSVPLELSLYLFIILSTEPQRW